MCAQPHFLLTAELIPHKTDLIFCELLDWLLSGGAERVEPGPTLCRLLADMGPRATLAVVPGEPKAARAGGRGCISSSYIVTRSWGRVDR